MNDLQNETQYTMDVDLFDCPFLEFEMNEAPELEEFQDLFA